MGTTINSPGVVPPQSILITDEAQAEEYAKDLTTVEPHLLKTGGIRVRPIVASTRPMARIAAPIEKPHLLEVFRTRFSPHLVCIVSG